MNRTAKRMFFLGFAFASMAWALASVVDAHAHGEHMSPIKPAYDCFYNPDGIDTRGDLVITHDYDLAVYVVWKCACEYLDQGHFRCWWRNKGQYKWKEDAVRRMRELEDYRYPGAKVVEVHVSWSAYHEGEGCFSHHDQRWVIRSKRSG